jgi:hypothetical protein
VLYCIDCIHTCAYIDYQLLCSCVEAFLEVERNPEKYDPALHHRFVTVMHRQLNYLKDRIILPELTLKYPTLFK